MTVPDARPRRVPRAGLVVGAVLLALLAGGVVLSTAQVAGAASVSVLQADAVAVHANDVARLDAGLELMERGVAPVLLISDVGFGYGRSRAELDALCATSVPFEVLCVTPEPVNTLGEARVFGQVAAARGWRRLVIVTDRAHLARARTSVEQCTGATVLPVAIDPGTTPGLGEALAEGVRLLATRTLFRAC